MIAKVVRGYRLAGLVAYLFGPGRCEEHRDPRVVAAWDGAPWLHQPDKLHSVALDGEVLPAGEFDFDLRQLIRTLTGPLKDAGLPTGGLPVIPAEWEARLRSGERLPSTAPAWLRHYVFDRRRQAVVARPGPMWHCSVRLHPDDPILTDEQWQQIAGRLMRAVGIHQAGCRWIAVRHADDHIHLAATLVSETTGRRFHPYRDYPKLRQACQQLEREFRLVATASADRTAAPAPSRVEKAKAARLGHDLTAREMLRHRVRRCAAVTQNGPDFLAALTDERLDPRTVHGTGGEVLGYTVALPYDRTAAGRLVRYSGARLAPDLTWPKLLTRWTGIPPVPRHAGSERHTPAERHEILQHATSAVDRALQGMPAGQEVDGIAHATGELLTVLGHGTDGYTSGPLTTVATGYDRAARTPHQVVCPTEVVARELRYAARRLAAIGPLTGRRHEGLATTALILALSGLGAEIATWHQHRGRTHQATAARSAAQALPGLAPQLPNRPVAHHAPPPSAAQLTVRPAAQPWASPAPESRSPGHHR